LKRNEKLPERRVGAGTVTQFALRARQQISETRHRPPARVQPSLVFALFHQPRAAQRATGLK
jgi:hypothetical protein